MKKIPKKIKEEKREKEYINKKEKIQ